MGLRDNVRTAMMAARMAQERRRRVVAPVVARPCPPGWQIGPPHYVGVGIQKAGTTWWYQAVLSHPDVLGSVRKELRFFQHHWNEEFTDARVSEYHRYFPRSGDKVTGEWTPRYMFDPWTAGRLHRAAPDARILVLLRDPVARLRSGLRHVAFHYSDRLHPRLVCEQIEFGRYAEQLDRLVGHFPRAQVLVLQFERCLADPEGELARTYEFLGVDAGFVPDDLRQRVNESQGPALAVASDLLDVARGLYRADAERLRAHWPEIDLALWPGVAG